MRRPCACRRLIRADHAACLHSWTTGRHASRRAQGPHRMTVASEPALRVGASVLLPYSNNEILSSTRATLTTAGRNFPGGRKRPAARAPAWVDTPFCRTSIRPWAPSPGPIGCRPPLRSPPKLRTAIPHGGARSRQHRSARRRKPTLVLEQLDVGETPREVVTDSIKPAIPRPKADPTHWYTESRRRGRRRSGSDRATKIYSPA